MLRNCFQQDSAPAYRARETISLLERETSAFISPHLWPTNSPDLNPVDYKIWGIMQQRIYQTKVQDVNDLKRRLTLKAVHIGEGAILAAIHMALSHICNCITQCSINCLLR